MSFSRPPRRLAAALTSVEADTAPRTMLAAVQSAWPRAMGEAIAAEAQPVGEREAVITVACRSATWAAELDLLSEQLLERLNQALGESQVAALRFTADGARHGLG
jgi:predicted nucleic acid-binding Zn ribbon protein